MGLEFGFRLWDGALVPADWPRDALAIAIADEGVVASLIRAPRLPTLANLWAAKRLDIVNGDLFDLVAKRPKARTRDLRKGLNKLAALRTSRAFLFVPRGGPWPLEAIGQDRESGGAEAENKKNIAYHYDVSNAFYSALARQGDGLHLRLFSQLERQSRRRANEQARHGLSQAAFEAGRDDARHRQRLGLARLPRGAALRRAVTGVTLSEQQIAYARDKVQRLGLADKVTFELRDYALLEGEERFDKITLGRHVRARSASRNFDTYFQTVHRLLKPGGLYLHHAITRPGKRAARKGARSGRNSRR